MFVKFKRNYFGPDGKFYRANKGMYEINDPDILNQLPSDAETFEGQNMPTFSPVPKPGFGAKPMEELLADLIPGAAPSKVLEPNKNTPPVDLSDPEEQARRKLAEEAQRNLQQAGSEDDKKDAEAEKADNQAKITSGLAAAQRIAEQQQAVVDPIAAAGEELAKAPAPKPASTKPLDKKN